MEKNHFVFALVGGGREGGGIKSKGQDCMMQVKGGTPLD